MRPLIILALTLTTAACANSHENVAQVTKPDWCQKISSYPERKLVHKSKTTGAVVTSVNYKKKLTAPSKEYIEQNCGKDTLS